MATLVFDIETVGENWNDLDAVTQASLTDWIDKVARTQLEKESLRVDIQQGLGFSPLTGRIVTIGLYDIDREEGAVYYTGNKGDDDFVQGSFVLKECSEKKMLENFWEGAKSYDTFVTFNGRGFDVPFLLHRSVALGVMPTCNLMEHRYVQQQKGVRHIDLQDELTFYGAMFRKPSLHLFCRAYGIESPKTKGVSGNNVTELFLQRKFRDIALYNSRDVIATVELYTKWLQFLAPASYFESLQ